MVCATVSFQSYFCWVFRASPSFPANNKISLILVLTVWWCPCVESSLVLLEEGICYDQYSLLAELYWPFPASFCISRPNFPVTPGISWFPTFAFQSPIMKRTSFGGLVLEGLVAAKSLQSCLTLCDPIDGSPGSAIPGILQARILEWVAISCSNAWKWKVKEKSLSRVWLLATPRTSAFQAPPSMGFSRQKYRSGVPFL